MTNDVHVLKSENETTCLYMCVDSLSLESWRESGLTGVGSLQDRLKLFALRSANANNEAEEESITHTAVDMFEDFSVLGGLALKTL